MIVSDTRVTDKGFESLIRYLPHNPLPLAHLDASHTHITDYTLGTLLKNSSSISPLTILRVNGISVTRRLAEELLAHFNILNKIQFGDQRCYLKFRDGIVIELGDSIDGGVAEIDLSHTRATNSILKNILSVHATPSLRIVKLNDSACNDNQNEIDCSLEQVLSKYRPRMPGLKSITIGHDENLCKTLQDAMPGVDIVII